MTHHRLLVKRRLSVEQNDIAIHDMAFDLPTVEELLATSSFRMTKINTFAIVSDNVTSTGVFVGAIHDKVLQLVNIVRRDDLRVSQRSRDTLWDTNFVK